MNVNQASIYVWIFDSSYELLDSSYELLDSSYDLLDSSYELLNSSYELLDSSSLESSFNKVLIESSPSSS